MTEGTINKLPECLRKHICTLKEASKDTANNEYMCKSCIDVVNFDKVPNEYSRGKGWGGVPKSNDALYIDIEGKWYFIEFKNGVINKEELCGIYEKLYDSLIMLLDCKIIPCVDFIRRNITYILVYNFKKNENYRLKIRAYAKERAKQGVQQFGMEKFEGYLFNKTHTYTPEEFKDNFVIPKEREEGILVA